MFSRSSFLRIGFIAFMIFVHHSGLAPPKSRLYTLYSALGGIMAPIWVAQDAGLFTKHGVASI